MLHMQVVQFACDRYEDVSPVKLQRGGWAARRLCRSAAVLLGGCADRELKRLWPINKQTGRPMQHTTTEPPSNVRSSLESIGSKQSGQFPSSTIMMARVLEIKTSG